ncbi:polysaccharide pyruvyl transferase family protein [Gorillibacterium sp. CAU 1737]|uniref:polysaccharide pyruvyl transferase family protein n=1 Tax=Gorillibacterium sp. CAU 1737 TaxID=3140362 RepID=UPI0032609268
MRIAACGYYGMGNFGDELFLLTYRQQLAGHEVFAWHPSFDPAAVDAVLIGGGDLIVPYSFASYYFPSVLQAKPTWVFGVGIVDAYPEATWPEREVDRYRRRLSGAHGIWLRDERSAAIAERIRLHSRIRTIPDPVFAYRGASLPIRPFSTRPSLGVCVHAYSGFPLESLGATLGRLSAEGFHILLLPAVNHSANIYADYGVCTALLDRILREPGASATVFKPEYELELIYAAIQRCDFLLSFKLHPTLAALRGGVPAFCVSKQGKVKSLLSRFGLEDFLEPDESAAGRIEAGLRRLLAEGKTRLQAAAPLLRQTEREAEAAFAELRREIEAE